jgi:Tol biopolymer transport system component
MNPTLRRLLIILGFIVVTLGFFFIIWFVFFRGNGTLTFNRNTGGITNGLPTPSNGNVNRFVPSNINGVPTENTGANTSSIAEGGATTVTTISQNSSEGAVVNGQTGDLQYYDRTNGKFFAVSPDGNTTTLLTTDVYPGANGVTWSPTGTQAVIGFPDSSNILYDFTTKRQTTLPNELADFSFSPAGDKLAAKFLDARDTENQWLVVSNPDGTQSQSVEHLGINASKVTVAWSPNQQIVATYAKSVTDTQQQIIFLGANNENFPSATVYGKGFTPNWSPDGQKLLFSTYGPLTNNNPHLYMMNGSPENLGGNTLDLGLTTSADKCGFAPSGATMYCAVPYYMNPGSGPQPSLSAGVPDNIYKIDLRSGIVSLIARPVDSANQQRFSAKNLRVAADESAVYFTDANTGTIQRIRLQ